MSDLHLNQVEKNLIYFRFSFLGLTTILSLSKSVTPNPAEGLSQYLTSQVDTIQILSNQLTGQWEFQKIFSVPTSVVLTAHGKGYLLVTNLTFVNSYTQGTMAYEFDYQIINNDQPFQIDITQPGEQPIKTIFEFTKDGRLRVELLGLTPNETRPTEFSAGAFLLERLSHLTALPRNTKIVNFLEEEIRAEEKNRKHIIGAILRAEQAYFLENETFTINLQELGLGLTHYQSPNYDLQIVASDSFQQELIVAAIANLQQELKKIFNINLQELGLRLILTYYQLLSYELPIITSDNLQQELIATVTDNIRPELIVTATAKIPGIKSFIGVVFIVNSQGFDFSVVQTCETIESSISPPDKPILNGRTIQCAIGSRVPENETSRSIPFGS